MDTQKSVELNEKSNLKADTKPVSEATVRKRFFVALLPPAEVQAKVNDIKSIMRDEYASKAAFRSPPHVTLLAPFEWPIAELPALANALRDFASGQAPVPMTLDGFAAFVPHVIYINVVQSDRIMTLHTDLLSHLHKHIGLESKRDQNRSFVPHMTVAFRDLKPSMFRKAWSVFQRREIHFDFTVGQLTLLIHDGKLWTVKEHYDFLT
ncbi:MAG: 2'-5' RNA ligase family protein [Cyanobacteria bacterium J06649_5]